MSSELAKPSDTKKPKQALKDLLEGDYFMAEVSKAMPFGSPKAFVRAALTAAMRNPELYKCEPNSVWQCLFDLAQMGLYPDGRRAHLVPYKGKCTLNVDYKGIAELARRHGDVAVIHCDVVHDGELYVCRYGSDGKLEHVPDIDCEDNAIKCVYSYVKFRIPDTEMLVEEYQQMSLKEVLRIRERSQSYQNKKGPWISDFNEMAKKTVFRRHSKTLSLSPETRKALEYGEEQEYGDLDRFHRAVPAIVPKPPGIIDVGDDAGSDSSETGSKTSEAEGKTEKAEDKPRNTHRKSPTVKKTAESKPEDQQANPFNKPVDDPRQTSFLPADEPKESAETPDAAPPSVDSLIKNLDHLIKINEIDKDLFFEWLRSLGIKHKAVTRFPNAIVMTSFDLSNANLVDALDNWEGNLETFRQWEQARNEAAQK